MRRVLCALLCVPWALFADFLEPPSAPPSETWGFRREIADGIDATGGAVLPEDAKPWLENRISRCFFGPIKRPPFNRDELMDDVDYYPEAYLAQLRDEGVNGLWLTVEFRDLVETSFNHRHPTAAKRLAKLRRTVETCAKYGIGIWVFAIEPRCGKAAPEFYERNKGLFARAYWPPCDDWDHLMCPSKPESRQYLKEALKDLFTQVPGLKGFMNISHGERWTTCLSQFPSCAASVQCPQTCPVCSKRQPWEVLNDILVPMRDGIREANPKAEFISWFYMPEPCAERNAWVYDCARHFPKGVTFQVNFESGVVCEQEGKPRVGGDYWLSQPGPSDIFRRVTDACREAGTRLSAKIQVSTSHEMATVPYVPVPGLLYRKFKAMHDCGVKDAMYCWYFGCNPGLMNRAAAMLSCIDFSEGEEDFLKRLAKAEWGEDGPQMARLWKRFSDAYANYPLSNMMQYYGPFHDGVVWELHPYLDHKPLARTWQCDRADGDTIGECLEGFDLDEACRLAEKMCAELADADDLDALAVKYANDRRRSREIGVMKAFRILCLSGRDILKFYRERRDAVVASRVRHDNVAALKHVREMTRLAVNAKGYSAEMLPLCAKDARLGFHSEAETYKFHPDLLAWRIRDIDRVLNELREIEVALSSSEGSYPLSLFERSAPEWNAERTADGGLVVEGEAAKDRTDDVVIDFYDETGSAYPTQVRVRPENGCFRTVIPEGKWHWIHVARPGLPDLPDVKTPVPGRLKLFGAAVRNCARLVPVETAKWQGEIDRVAAAGGGVVTVPAGIHRVGGLELRNNVELHLEKGAVLEALYGLENYRVVKLPYSEGDWSAIVMGLNVTNVAVTGEGAIDGQGAKWPAPPKDFKGCQEGLRPRGLFFAHSKGIRLEGYTLRNAACWGQVFKNCDGVTARRVTVFSHGNLNNDGFDIEAKNVLIEECVADTGDDEFCIKSNDPSFTVENVTIRNCIARGQASAFKIGTATRGTVRHVRVENLRCEPPRGIFSQYADGTPARPLFHFTVYDHQESYPYGFGLVGVAVECVDGGRVEDVAVDGVTFADGYKIPIFVRADRRACHNKGDGLKRGEQNVLKDIVIRNVRGSVIGPMASSITGTKDFRVQNVLLENIDIVQPGAGEAAGRRALADPAPYRENCYPAPDIFHPGILPAYGLYVDYADNVVLKNVKFRTLAEGPVEIRSDIVRTGR